VVVLKNVENRKLFQRGKISELFGSFVLCLRAFTGLDASDMSNTMANIFSSRRMITLVIFFCGMLNFYVYNAGLISYLMVQDYELPINELKDILEKPEYKLLVESGGNDENFLKNSTNPGYTQLWEKISDEKGLLGSYTEGKRELIRDNQKVFFAESPTFETMFESYSCQVMRSRIGYNSNNGAYGFNKDSEYIELFSHHIIKILESGLDTERLSAAKEGIQCLDSTTNHFRMVSYEDVISAFAILVLGCLLAFAHSAFEFLYKVHLAERIVE
jgi:hypothetical protein